MHGYHHDHHDRRFARDAHRFGEEGRGRGRDHGGRDHGGRDHGPWEERGRRGGPERERRRLFDHGELRLVVLALIAEQPRHGYELIKEIEDRTAGTYSPSPGVIYPTLTMLEELGHATISENGGKKLYAVTPEGLAYRDANAPAVAAALERMQSVRAAHGGGPAPEITRATGNLRTALRLRLARGPLTEEQLRAVAAALDAAAVAIERS